MKNFLRRSFYFFLQHIRNDANVSLAKTFRRRQQGDVFLRFDRFNKRSQCGVVQEAEKTTIQA